jgi:hypothetical protein
MRVAGCRLLHVWSVGVGWGAVLDRGVRDRQLLDQTSNKPDKATWQGSIEVVNHCTRCWDITKEIPSSLRGRRKNEYRGVPVFLR